MLSAHLSPTALRLLRAVGWRAACFAAGVAAMYVAASAASLARAVGLIYVLAP